MPSWTSTGKDTTPRRKGFWQPSLYGGLVLGILFGLGFRLSTNIGVRRPVLAQSGHYTSEITFCFLVLGPFVVGFLSCFPAARRGELTGWAVLGLSCTAMLMVCLGSAAFLLEGTICIVMLLPIGILLGVLGGLLAWFLGRRMPYPRATVSCMALLPVLLAPVEAQRGAPTQLRTVESQIRIHATPQAVWQQIQSVPAIAPSELQPSWAHRIGFPRPIAATLSHPGVGGVRTATFEHGLTFFETVTTWQPNRTLAFSIHADTAHIPPTTLDEHVTVGGPYFDVLDGEYRIEPLAKCEVLLHLTSHQRLSTDVNGYAGLWTVATMQNLQTSILQVIQHRSEALQSAYNEIIPQREK